MSSRSLSYTKSAALLHAGCVELHAVNVWWVWRVCRRGEEGSEGGVGTTPSDTHHPSADGCPVRGHINSSGIANGANLSVICAGLIRNTCLLHNGSSVAPRSSAVSLVKAPAGWLWRRMHTSCLAVCASRAPRQNQGKLTQTLNVFAVKNAS